ncbi:MAG: hypothetical protein KQH83_06605 [Actinobacteria bacterium]|nr:hypothetical protein [Actinomycetota bacterium]
MGRHARRIGLVAAALATAACSSGGDATDGIATLEGQPAATTAAVDVEVQAEESILALAECFREEGVDMPDPEFDDAGNFRLRSLMDVGEAFQGVDEDDLREAFLACSHHLDGVAQLLASIDRTDMEDRLYEYASCMRDQGYDMPDPDFGAMAAGGPDGPGGGGPFGEIDPDDPEFREANEVCIGVFGETVGPGGFGPAVEGGG